MDLGVRTLRSYLMAIASRVLLATGRRFVHQRWGDEAGRSEDSPPELLTLLQVQCRQVALNLRLATLIYVLTPGDRKRRDLFLASASRLVNGVEKCVEEGPDDFHQTLIFIACHDGFGMHFSEEGR